MKIKIIEVKEAGDFLFVKVELDSKIRKFSFPKSYQDKDKGSKKPFWLHEIKNMLSKSRMKKEGVVKRVNNEFIGKEFELEDLEDLSPKALFEKCKKRDLKYLHANAEKLSDEVWVRPVRSSKNKEVLLPVKSEPIKVRKKEE